MISERLNTILFSLFLIGILGLAVGVVLHMVSVIFIFQLILTVTVVVYIFSIVRMTFV